ncbi:Cytosolic sulfotransferase 12 [Platanthera guangdongensis]|uniref:Cytosolic sulfotransferase 12 n=1 Tax=Platanthera guangdongensis TaxID=2320717 RepID=A0ABR2MJ84_9ASPA
MLQQGRSPSAKLQQGRCLTTRMEVADQRHAHAIATGKNLQVCSRPDGHLYVLLLPEIYTSSLGKTRHTFIYDELRYERRREAISNLPVENGWRNIPGCLYYGFWFNEPCLYGVLSPLHNFCSSPSYIFRATCPKSGTTWLKALAFAICNRGSGYMSSSSNGHHSILSLNPHEFYPNLENFYASLYVPKVMELFCKGQSPYGPVWEHQLEYWPESQRCPDSVVPKGKIGDWREHLWPMMVEKVDTITKEKLHGTGLSHCNLEPPGDSSALQWEEMMMMPVRLGLTHPEKPT